MERWKNYGLWASILAFIPLILEGFNVHILPANYKDICAAILGILVLAGIISNPKEGTGYLDEISTDTTKPENTDIDSTTK